MIGGRKLGSKGKRVFAISTIACVVLLTISEVIFFLEGRSLDKIEMIEETVYYHSSEIMYYVDEIENIVSHKIHLQYDEVDICIYKEGQIVAVESKEDISFLKRNKVKFYAIEDTLYEATIDDGNKESIISLITIIIVQALLIFVIAKKIL